MTGTDKAKRRLESKKRKISAFLQIAALNDSDKRRKLMSGTEDVPEEDKKTKTVAGPCAKGPLLSGDSYLELKQRLRERKKLLRQIPDFDLKTPGHEAEIDMLEQFRTPLFMTDLQQLFLHALLGNKAPVEAISSQRWCKFSSWNKLTGIICLVIEGVGLKDFHEHREGKFSGLAAFLKFKLEFLSPAVYDSRISEDFSLLPVRIHQRERLKKKFGAIESAIEHGSAYKILRSLFPAAKQKDIEKDIQKSKDSSMVSEPGLKLKLLLNVTQMIEEGYPIPFEGPMRAKYQNFVFTKSEYTEVTDCSPLFSVDCEMCITEAGNSELTKICVVNSDLEVVYSTFVKPKNAIRNYLTKFSGITAEMLEGVTTSLDDVQKAIIDILPSDAILVGHSLNSDLCAMQMMHPYIIDTSVIYCVTGERRRKSKLSALSKMFLGEEIQQDRGGSHIGHDPKEDAEAAMKLVLLKLRSGYNFGDVLLDGTLPTKQHKTESPNDEILTNSIFTHAKENDKSVCIVGEKQILKQYKKYSAGVVAETPQPSSTEDSQPSSSENSPGGVVYRKAESSKDAILKSCELSFDHNMTLCHVDVSSLENEFRVSASENADNEFRPLTPKAVKYVKKWTEKLWNHTSKNGLFVTVWTGDKSQNAFVGIAINKAQVVIPPV